MKNIAKIDNWQGKILEWLSTSVFNRTSVKTCQMWLESNNYKWNSYKKHHRHRMFSNDGFNSERCRSTTCSFLWRFNNETIVETSSSISKSTYKSSFVQYYNRGRQDTRCDWLQQFEFKVWKKPNQTREGPMLFGFGTMVHILAEM